MHSPSHPCGPFHPHSIELGPPQPVRAMRLSTSSALANLPGLSCLCPAVSMPGFTFAPVLCPLAEEVPGTCWALPSFCCARFEHGGGGGS